MKSELSAILASPGCLSSRTETGHVTCYSLREAVS